MPNPEVSIILTALALLAAPGPTNTLLAVSGATRGFLGSLVLLPGEVLAYLIAINLTAVAVAPLVSARPVLGIALRLALSVYLVYAAWKLWRYSETELGSRPVTLRGVFVTTLLNPKASLLALMLVPAGGPRDLTTSLVWTGALSFFIAIIGACWIAAGSLAERGLERKLGVGAFCRAGAIVLMLFAGLIGGSAVAADWH
jgi:threonine/homoserine/homoserine lactone efflux protein